MKPSLSTRGALLLGTILLLALVLHLSGPSTPPKTFLEEAADGDPLSLVRPPRTLSGAEARDEGQSLTMAPFKSLEEIESYVAARKPSYWQYLRRNDPLAPVGPDSIALQDSSQTAPQDGLGSLRYSHTNLQIEGLDEPDIVKTDGRHAYIASDRQVTIALVYPPEEAELLSEIGVSGRPAGLFVEGNRLAVIEEETRWAASPQGMPASETRVKIYDISDRRAPGMVNTVSMDGILIGARLAGGAVRLVIATQARPWESPDDTVFLPSLRKSETVQEVAPGEVLFTPDEREYYGFVTVLTFSLADGANLQRQTFLTRASQAYFSAQAVYLTGYEYGADRVMYTRIHKVDITDTGPQYRTSVRLPGDVKSIAEDGGYLRVSQGRWNGHGGTDLYVLNDDLVVVGALAELPTSLQANLIGSTGVLLGNHITIIDLSNPTAPIARGMVSGENVRYLFQFDSTRYVMVGEVNTPASEGLGKGPPEGIRISLLDVSKPARPRITANFEIGVTGADSPAWRDQKAILFDAARDLLVIPVKVEGTALQEGMSGEAAPDDGIWLGALVLEMPRGLGIELVGAVSYGASRSYAEDIPHASARTFYIEDVLYAASPRGLMMVTYPGLDELGRIDAFTRYFPFNHYPTIWVD